MRFLYIDIDTLRPDHLGCYGYGRNTSPTIDRIAGEGVRFTNCYASDAPCLPSRSAFWTGRFGIHTGVVNHDGTAADPFLQGSERKFKNDARPERMPWMVRMRRSGLKTVSVSPFAGRHSAWWFYEGFAEMHDPGKGGGERADEINPTALAWIRRNAKQDNWFLHVNYWDPHTTYRTPESYGNPFEGEPIPAWHTEEVRRRHWESFGPHSAPEPFGFGCEKKWGTFPRQPDAIASMEDYRRWIDGYDTGIRYADDHVGKLLEELDRQGVLDDLVIMVSSDHGENQGELNVYGDHQTADYCTSRVPMIVRWPGITQPRVDDALYYQLDFTPTLTELAGGECSARWDGRSFAEAMRKGESAGRESLVVSQCAWSAQRSVRMGDWMMIRTYHDGLKDFPDHMLFDVAKDPHETKNVAAEHPEVVAEAAQVLEDWHGAMMRTSETNVDPLGTVLREGPCHANRRHVTPYCKRLRETGRAHHAQTLEQRHEQKS